METIPEKKHMWLKRETQSCIIYPKFSSEVETKVEISSATERPD